jgi:hypothetical protein
LAFTGLCFTNLRGVFCGFGIVIYYIFFTWTRLNYNIPSSIFKFKTLESLGFHYWTMGRTDRVCFFWQDF